MRTIIKRPQDSTSIALRDQPTAETDAEPLWLFEEAEIEIGTPSNWHSLVESSLDGTRRQGGGGQDFYERRADAYHRASIIVGWLERLSPTDGAVLVAAYQPRPWPHRYELKLRRLAGVVPTLASVRAEYLAAVARGHTEAEDVVRWLDEAIACREDAVAERAAQAALLPYARALAAYRAVRGTGHLLVEPDP